MYQPIGKFILTEPIKLDLKREETTKSGVILQNNEEIRQDLMVTKANVVGVGDEITKIKVKDVVLYNYFSGNNIVIPGKDPLGKDDKMLHLVFESDVLAKEVK